MHLVMFDIDGTLVNTGAFEMRLFKQAVEDVLEITCPDTWEGITHVTGTGIIAELMLKQKEKELSQKDHDRVRDRFIDLIMDELADFPEKCPALAGGIDLYNRLMANDNYKVTVATGTWGPVACFKLATAGYDLDDLIMATGDDHFDRMEIMLLARERAEDKLPEGTGFESVTYIGDGKWDQLATDGLGWRFIGVGEMVKDAPLHIDDFEGADNLVMGLN